jgi:hypothetical protein
MNSENLMSLTKASHEKLTEKLVGQEYYGAKVLEVAGKTEKSRVIVLKVLCRCGSEFICRSYDLLRGHTRTCGCMRGNKKKEAANAKEI